jgi:hypothetical protein
MSHDRISHQLPPRNEVHIDRLIVTQIMRNSSCFMEPEGSLTRLQEITIVAVPKPRESNPHTISISFILILSTHLCLAFQVVSNF